MKLEIGDVFIINPYRRCIRKNKRFRIVKFSKSELSVYYRDSRTNNPCKCQNCTNEGMAGLKCIGISGITLVETRVQYERNIKLKQII